jgi:hypothetical protein
MVSNGPKRVQQQTVWIARQIIIIIIIIIIIMV